MGEYLGENAQGRWRDARRLLYVRMFEFTEDVRVLEVKVGVELDDCFADGRSNTVASHQQVVAHIFFVVRLNVSNEDPSVFVINVVVVMLYSFIILWSPRNWNIHVMLPLYSLI